ncbi:MAG: hypothetical protein JSV87_00790 [Candidatus Bathyarchaeota archaeon]|nr:MAG: hypothetical protein JSV87_00790 [Candidatus Bathyarchaeota archaeon]
MVSDFFSGFVAHAHTRNEIETDPNEEMALRRRNNPDEAQKLVEAVLDKIERDISTAGYTPKDVRLLILYLSYRGDNEEKDRRICESILRAIENRFRNKSNQLRLIGHTTAGEIENEDLRLSKVSGIGYNGLSLLALVTNLPVGVGRTFGLGTPEEALEQGREMVHDAWVDFTESVESREHAQKSKTLFVLTQGPTVGTLQVPGKKGFEHFLAEGIAGFVGHSREAKITRVIGGSSGDGLVANTFRQFYGKLGRQSEFKALNNEAVCVLIPNLLEPSIGSDVTPIRRIGKSHTFNFDHEAMPKFIDIKSIDNKDPAELFADVIFENEASRLNEEGKPWIAKKELFSFLSEFQGIPVHPAIGKYAFVFPFGNYTPVCPIRVTKKRCAGREERIMDLAHPIRSYEATMKGYVAEIDYAKVQKGTRKLYKMLRENREFSKRDVTLIVSCISRRLAELMAGCESKTEAEILKDALSSTQLLGFLAYGELWSSHLLEEPYHHNFSCWGITFRSQEGRKEERKIAEPVTLEVSEVLPGRISTGYEKLDNLLLGGIPKNYAVVLTAPSCDERNLLIEEFLETGVKNDEVTFCVTTDPGKAKSLAKEFPASFFLLICNPQADQIIRDMPNVFKLKGVENLTNINIALTSAFRGLDRSPKAPKRACIEVVSDILLQHHAVQTRKWLTALIPELKAKGFTTLAVMDRDMHSPQEVHAIIGLFEGEISLYEKKTRKGSGKFLKVKKMYHQRYLESEQPLRRGEPETKASQTASTPIHAALQFAFASKAAEKTFNYLVRAFIEDYMKRRLFIQEAGWRSLVQITKGAGVSARSVYGSGGRHGSAMSELVRRGLVETRIFPGERGRGGRIVKVRISYERETMKRYVDHKVAARGRDR